MTHTGEFSIREEFANAITHGIGALLGVVALILLVVFASLQGTVWHIVSFSIYGSTLVMLYLASTLYHSFQNKRIKSKLKVCDHAAIYLLIAGTYTPFTLVTLNGALGWTLFGIVWGLALVGIVFKIFFIKKFPLLSTLFYIAMGWMAVIAIKPLVDGLPTFGWIWLVVGGVLYTLGTIFYTWRIVPYHHAIWHLFVLAGSAAHFISIFFYVLPS